jgi:flagellar assembly factor FliW
MIRSFKTRFGAMDIDDSKAIHFPTGMIGFPQETLFVLLEGKPGRAVSYLQSLRTPGLAFPVIDGGTIGDNYPQPTPTELASAVGIEMQEPAVLVVVAANGSPPTLFANLLAPIIVDAGERRAAQVVLDPVRYSASFRIVPPAPRPAPPSDILVTAADAAAREANNAKLADSDAA